MAEKPEVSSGGATPMCANGCGFFGNAATKNFCSKCYNDVFETAVEATTAEKTTASNPENIGNKTAAVAPPPVKKAGESSTSTAVKEEKRQEAAPAVVLCVRGCGFLGSAATGNMCSKCYLDSTTTTVGGGATTPDYLLEEMIRADMAAVATTAIKKIEEEKPAEAAAEGGVEASSAAPNRCATCRKKVGLLGFPCRCGGTFCSLHRLAEKHACEFDFKKAGREQITKSNPLVVAPKLEKI